MSNRRDRQNRWRAGIETPDRLSLSRRASAFPLLKFYNMTSRLIRTAAVVALSESTTHMGFDGGDDWTMSQDHRKRQETGGLVGRVVGRSRPNLG
jgi:hypothetical protein